MASCFLGGYIPGISLGVALMLLCYVIARYRNYPKSETTISLSQAIKTTSEAIWGLLTIFHYFNWCHDWHVYSNRVSRGGSILFTDCYFLYLSHHVSRCAHKNCEGNVSHAGCGGGR